MTLHDPGNSSLVDECWYQLTVVLNFSVFNRPQKEFKLHTDYSEILEQIKPLQQPGA